MKKRIIRYLMVIYIVSLFVISFTFLPAIADPGDGNGIPGCCNPGHAPRGGHAHPASG